jgi:DNA repair protein RadC
MGAWAPGKGTLEDKQMNTKAKSAGRGVKSQVGSEAKSSVRSRDFAGSGNSDKAVKRKSSRPLKRDYQFNIPQYRLILVKEPGVKPVRITSPISFHHFLKPLALYSEEHFIAFHLDAKFQVVGYHEVSKGTLNASLVHPREVFKAALLSNAFAIIVAHNHPSGSIEASMEDIETTKTLIKAGRILGISVIDHCIVSSESVNSLRETSPEFWAD